MIIWHRIEDHLFEGRIGNAVLATVWFDSPLFRKSKATWRCRTTFPGINSRGFGAATPTREEAMRRVENFLKQIAEDVLTR